MHWAMRRLIARWVALIAMLGLLASVMLPVAYHACLTGCGLPYKCIVGENPRRGKSRLCPRCDTKQRLPVRRVRGRRTGIRFIEGPRRDRNGTRNRPLCQIRATWTKPPLRRTATG